MYVDLIIFIIKRLEQKIALPFFVNECDIESILKKTLKQHMQADVEQHLEKMLDCPHANFYSSLAS